MIRNTPKNSVVPAMKHDMAKRIMGGKLLNSPPKTPRSKPLQGGNLVAGYKHGPTGKNLTMRKGKSFMRGAMGSQQGQVGQGKGKVGGGWEISHE